MSQSEEEKAIMLKVPFRELVESLLYLAGTTRPDIFNAVINVAKFSDNPVKMHWRAAKKIHHYLS